jgi:Fur family ferric uptake transcriptional regulator
MTRQRSLILEIVKNGRHFTADEVYEKVREVMPHVSMGTVYRNLDTLSSLGHIIKLQPDRPQMCFDGNTSDHYHVTCMRCGRIEDAPLKPRDNALENLEDALGNLTKYGIFGHKLEFVGLCQDCMSQEEDFFERRE